MGIYLFTREVLLELIDQESGIDFGRELIPSALGRYHVNAFLHHGYWADVGTVDSFYEANIMLTRVKAPFRFYDARRPIYTHARFLPPSRALGCRMTHSLVAEGTYLNECVIADSVIGIRSMIGEGTTVRRSVLLGADHYAGDDVVTPPGTTPIGIGRDCELDRVIVDKNARIGDGARLVNARGIDHEDGQGYYIRNGIIIVPKGGVIAPGTVV
jgi:glucose-1-phosphate adenylyltransferase